MVKINKKIIFVIIIFILLSLTNNVFIKANSLNLIRNQENKNWTFLFYDDADFISSWYDPGIFDITRESLICKNINIIVLQDTFYGPAKLWKVGPFGFKKIIKQMGELDMGDYQTLKDFIQFCKDNYPADRYWLDIFNHGAGWRGACEDITNNSFLEMNEIKRAVVETGGVDIISFIAPCNMAAIESVYDLRDWTEVYIGSQAGNGFDIRLLRPLFNILNNQNHLSNIEIGNKFIEIKKGFRKGLYDYFLPAETLSAIRTDRINDLVYSIDNLSFYLNNNIDDLKKNINKALDKTEKFADSIDILDFVYNFKEIKDLDKVLYEYLDKIIDNFKNAIINEYHSDLYPNSNGLSIFSPRPIFFATGYFDKDVILDFKDDTYWDEFVYNFTKDNRIIVDVNGSGDYTKIQDAINASLNFTIIKVRQGTYIENLEIKKSIHLIGDKSNKTIINGNHKGNIVEITNNLVFLQDFIIKNSGANYSGIYISSDYVIISNSTMSENNNGIFVNKSYKAYIINNKFEKNTLGLLLNSSYNNFISYNKFIKNEKDAFFSDSRKIKWDKNFWGKKRMLPKIIFGEKTFFSFKIPAINIDFNPLDDF